MDYEKLYEIWEKHGVITYLEEEYRKEFNSWNWETVKNNSEEIEDIVGEKVNSFYLGTVFDIFPSGKFYTPWTCSNVTPKEIIKDEIFIEILETEFLEPREYWLESGEGDCCDLFIINNIEE